MAIETLPEPTIAMPAAARPRFGFLTSTPIIAVATICLAAHHHDVDPRALDRAARSDAAVCRRSG